MAAPKVNQVLSGVNGLEIKVNKFDTIQQGARHIFNFHIFNGQDGLGLKDPDVVNCSFHLYTEWGGDHIVEEWNNVFTDVWDIEFSVAGKNFSRTGEYSYIIQCECIACGVAQENLGGFTTTGFEVTATGEPAQLNLYFFLLFLMSILLVWSLWSNNFIFQIFIGIMMILMSLTIYKGYLTNGIGVGSAVVAIFFSLIGLYVMYMGILETLNENATRKRGKGIIKH